MRGQGNRLDVRRIPTDASDHEFALHVALGLPPSRPGGVEPYVAEMKANARRGLGSIDLLFGAYTGAELITACVAVESPGRAAMVFVPCDQSAQVDPLPMSLVLRALQQAAWQRSIRLLEVLLPPGCVAVGRVLEESGFRYLTTLLYLTRYGHQIERASRPARDLSWVAYAPDREPLFCEALDASYVQSLDCPELAGLRTTSEVLEGHRAKPGFDPDSWWVALRGGAAVGVLLLNRIESRHALEIEYIGVAQPSRGTGVADALLERMTGAARQQNAKYVTLAVDQRNTTARKMYARWSFVETLSRDAFIASSPGI